MEWVQGALRKPESRASPLNSFYKLTNYADFFSPESERMANESFKALLAPIPLPMLMDDADAKDCLKYVEDKVVTRAAKRAAEHDAAIAAREEANRLLGEARVAFRLSVASRPVKTRRVVDNFGRSHVF